MDSLRLEKIISDSFGACRVHDGYTPAEDNIRRTLRSLYNAEIKEGSTDGAVVNIEMTDMYREWLIKFLEAMLKETEIIGIRNVRRIASNKANK